MTPQEKKAYNANYYKTHKDYWQRYRTNIVGDLYSKAARQSEHVSKYKRAYAAVNALKAQQAAQAERQANMNAAKARASYGRGKGIQVSRDVKKAYDYSRLGRGAGAAASTGLTTARSNPTRYYGVSTATRVSDIGSSFSSGHILTKAAKKAVSAIGDAASYLAKKAKSVWNFLF